jgi:hypothetical protein
MVAYQLCLRLVCLPGFTIKITLFISVFDSCPPCYPQFQSFYNFEIEICIYINSNGIIINIGVLGSS